MTPSATDDWTIRRATAEDAEGLGGCLDAAYARYAESLADLPPISADCAGEIARNQVWVADAAGAIVGGLVLVPGDGFMVLANVAVHPERHGGGIGRRLLALAETEARRQGFGELRLTTHAGMPEAIALYRRNGWLPADRHGNKVKMRKTLRP